MAAKKGMDLGTVIGICTGLGSLVGSIIMEFNHLNPELGSVFLKISALLIIFGGTSGAVMISFPFKVFMRIPKYISIALTEKHFDIPELITTITRLSDLARREGILRLESELAGFAETNPFLARGLQFIVDGTEPKGVREMLENEVSRMQERHKEGKEVFMAIGGFCPTMGIVGTVIGLIGALSMAGAAGSDPGKIVGAIATAFIATFYGIGSANLIFLPIANKLKAHSEHEAFYMEVVIEGLLALQQGENSRLVYERLRVLLQRKAMPDLKK